MTAVLLFLSIHLSCLSLKHRSLIFNAYVLGLNTQKEPGHCGLFSLIYGNFSVGHVYG